VRTVLEAYDPTAATPAGPADEDRYLSLATAHGWNKDSIYQWDAGGAVWVETVPDLGMATFVTGGIIFAGQTVAWNGTEWVNTGFANDHGGLVGLADDDHLQYVKVTGRAGDVVTMPNTTASTTPANGCLVLGGGLGVGKAVNAAGKITTTDATASTSTTTGSIISAGGMGLGGAINLPSGSASMMGRVGLGGTAPDANIPLLSYRVGNYSQMAVRNWNGVGAIDGYFFAKPTAAGGLIVTASGGTEDFVTLGSGVSGKAAVIIPSDLAASSATTGALRVTGGGGFGGKVVTGAGLETTSATASTTTSTGSGIFAGGVGIAGAVNAGGVVKTADATVADAMGNGSIVTAGGVSIVKNIVMKGAFLTADTTASSSTSTGSGVFGGGIGVAERVTATNMTCLTAPVAPTDVVRLTDIPASVDMADYVKVNGRVGDIVLVNNTTQTSTFTTGALKVAGGVAVEKNLVVHNGTIGVGVIPSAGIPLSAYTTANPQICLWSRGATANVYCTFTVPSADSGGLSIAPQAGITSDATKNAIGLGTSGQAHSVVTVHSTAASTNTTTGGLVVVGGLGVAGAVNVGLGLRSTGPIYADGGIGLTSNLLFVESATPVVQNTVLGGAVQFQLPPANFMSVGTYAGASRVRFYETGNVHADGRMDATNMTCVSAPILSTDVVRKADVGSWNTYNSNQYWNYPKVGGDSGLCVINSCLTGDFTIMAMKTATSDMVITGGTNYFQYADASTHPPMAASRDPIIHPIWIHEAGVLVIAQLIISRDPGTGTCVLRVYKNSSTGLFSDGTHVTILPFSVTYCITA
jgi:hypothetical protein